MTRSKPVGRSSVRTSQCCTVTFWAGISCRIVVLMSSDVTRPDEPTRSASHSVTLPLPPPSSRQRQPGPTPMASR